MSCSHHSLAVRTTSVRTWETWLAKKTFEIGVMANSRHRLSLWPRLSRNWGHIGGRLARDKGPSDLVVEAAILRKHQDTLLLIEVSNPTANPLLIARWYITGGHGAVISIFSASTDHGNSRSVNLPMTIPAGQSIQIFAPLGPFDWRATRSLGVEAAAGQFWSIGPDGLRRFVTVGDSRCPDKENVSQAPALFLNLPERNNVRQAPQPS